MYTWRLVVISLALMILVNCASVPLRTMWQMRGFGPETLTEIDPAEIRAGVMSDLLLMDHPDMENVQLHVSMTIVDEPRREHRFHMHDVTEREIHRVPSAERGMSWRIYKLSTDEVDEFRQMQHAFSRWLLDDEVEMKELEMGVHFVILEESEDFIDGLNRMMDGVRESHPHPEQVDDALQEWKSEGLPIRIDLQLFAESGFMQLIRTTRIPITGPQDT